ncbi:hypothetical protein RFI_35995 [Reticulomyxa filosa]|uniref:Uncharacterized protein n=1 Tax=Reticulomyxa filosa TaxID=46433 RepID=X6LL61_RETFI|nr:hypothetical protein RFI_35995 [Reticulomyxa filosa]|eukprot:ETO01445.1 hypothetical protein RFI_35995 [Reticulomyxa filosa]
MFSLASSKTKGRKKCKTNRNLRKSKSDCPTMLLKLDNFINRIDSFFNYKTTNILKVILCWIANKVFQIYFLLTILFKKTTILIKAKFFPKYKWDY